MRLVEELNSRKEAGFVEVGENVGERKKCHIGLRCGNEGSKKGNEMGRVLCKRKLDRT